VQIRRRQESSSALLRQVSEFVLLGATLAGAWGLCLLDSARLGSARTEFAPGMASSWPPAEDLRDGMGLCRAKKKGGDAQHHRPVYPFSRLRGYLAVSVNVLHAGHRCVTPVRTESFQLMMAIGSGVTLKSLLTNRPLRG
jgi:hypothetical protein